MSNLILPIAVIIGLAWLGVVALVVSLCRMTAGSDREISQAFPREHVTNRAQKNLEIAPERPVGDVQIVDRPHLA